MLNIKSYVIGELEFVSNSLTHCSRLVVFVIKQIRMYFFFSVTLCCTRFCACPSACARSSTALITNAISLQSSGAGSPGPVPTSPSAGGGGRGHGSGVYWARSRLKRLVLALLVSWGLGLAMIIVGAVSVEKCDEQSTEEQVRYKN